MKENRVRVLIQPSGISDYWIQRLLDGIREETQRIKKQFAASYFSVQEETEPLVFSEPVLLVGTTTKWLSASAEYTLSRGGVPIVVNACMPELPFAVSGVCFALEHSVEECLQYLRQLGKKQPALIGLNLSSDADQRKAAVFHRVAKETGALDLCRFCEHAGLEESIADSVTEMLELGADALLCSNDTAAILVIACLKQKGIAAGKDFPVIGMGNSFLGMNALPPLTTVNFDYFALGRESVRLYEYLLANDTAPQALVRIPTELIVRASTGDVPYNRFGSTRETGTCSSPDYFGGSRVSRLIMLENDLQHCDPIDREIIFGTARGETYLILSERLYLSERTLKYRLSHILKRLGLHSKSELCALVQEVFGDL